MRRDRVREDSVFGRRERVHGTIVRRNLPAVDRQHTSSDRILDDAHRCETNVHPELVRQGLPNGKQHRYVATGRTSSRSAGANYRSTGRETPPEEHMIDATENSLAILEAVHQNDRAGVTALADETGLAKAPFTATSRRSNAPATSPVRRRSRALASVSSVRIGHAPSRTTPDRRP